MEGHIVSKMYCFTEQSEAVGGWLVFVCLVVFFIIIIFLDPFDLPFYCLSLHLLSVSPTSPG